MLDNWRNARAGGWPSAGSVAGSFLASASQVPSPGPSPQPPSSSYSIAGPRSGKVPIEGRIGGTLETIEIFVFLKELIDFRSLEASIFEVE